MPFEIYTGYQPLSQPFIFVDKFGRISLSRSLLHTLGITPGQPFHALLGYDPDNGNIGIAVPGEISGDGKLVVFDGKRYCASVAGFVRKYNLKPGRYLRIPQTWNGWHQFRREDLLNP
jgi:hypothetical protein